MDAMHSKAKQPINNELATPLIKWISNQNTDFKGSTIKGLLHFNYTLNHTCEWQKHIFAAGNEKFYKVARRKEHNSSKSVVVTYHHFWDGLSGTSRARTWVWSFLNPRRELVQCISRLMTSILEPCRLRFTPCGKKMRDKSAHRGRYLP